MKKGFWTIVKDIIRKSDIVLEVLDARMPELTRNKKLEGYAKDYGKKLIIVVNKIDLASDESIKNIKSRYKDLDYVLISSKMFKGMKDLIKSIKSKFNKDEIRVAIMGYPNTGKSSLINKLSKGGKARTSSESGFTKGLQLISGKAGLMLVDTPGVVPYEARDEIRLGLMSGISPQKLKNPDLVACELLNIFKKNNPSALEKEYGVDSSLDSYELLEEIGKNKKMLLKGGLVDETRAAIQILNDWHKGKIKI